MTKRVAGRLGGEICYYDDITVLSYYFPEIIKLPVTIKNPLRGDNHPSLGFCYFNDRIYVKDFGTNQNYTLYSFLQQYFHKKNEDETIQKINKDLTNKNIKPITISQSCNNKPIIKINKYEIKITVRDWLNHDIDYWTKYGVNMELLKYCNVSPIKYYYLYNIQDDTEYSYVADKYAYVYREIYDDKLLYKIYQPYSKEHKWYSGFNGNVVSLINKIPKTGDLLCICSSVKDALCLWSNLKIPSICPQGEGYDIPANIIKSLKERYKKIMICYDNDKTGLEDAEKLAKKTNFINFVLPQTQGAKDISDLYKKINNKDIFISIMKKRLSFYV